MNGVTLTYSQTKQHYEGNVAVPPGGAVSLAVTDASGTYAASATQFTSYPNISGPVSGKTLDHAVANTVTWSGGTATANAAKFGLGILDAADPNGLLLWPYSGFLKDVPLGETSYSIPAFSIPGGSRLVLVGIASSGTPISNAAPGSKLVVGGFNYVPVSVTGLPITVRNTGTTDGLWSVVWSGTQFVAVGGTPTRIGTILTSPDGTTWTPRTSGTTAGLDAVAWSGTQFVAVGSPANPPAGGPATILTSSDGISWIPRVSGTVGDLTGVAWSGTQFVAVGSTGGAGTSGTILTSSDGITWTHQISGTSQHIHAVLWSGTQFVAVGTNGLALTSPNGITWSAQNSGTTISLKDVTWSGTQFVAVGPNSCCGDVILTSPDGVTWTQRSSGGTWPRAVTWAGTQFVAVGWVSNVGQTIITSPDGATWTRQVSGADGGQVLSGVAWSGTTLVIVGGGGTVLTSP